MKKLISCLLALQFILVLAGCCCPCGKKDADRQNQDVSEETQDDDLQLVEQAQEE